MNVERQIEAITEYWIKSSELKISLRLFVIFQNMRELKKQKKGRKYRK